MIKLSKIVLKLYSSDSSEYFSSSSKWSSQNLCFSNHTITSKIPPLETDKLINYSTLQNTAASLSNLILGDEVFLAEDYSVHTKTTKHPASQTFPAFAQESDGNHSWGKATKRLMVLKRGAWDWHRETGTWTTATGKRLGSLLGG